MNGAIETIEYRGHTILIHLDDDAQDPRKEFDYLGHMVCWHRRYNLGDKHNFSDPSDAKEMFKETHALVLLLYLYDHSGITMSSSPFSCPWDSGQVGYIYVTLEEVKKEWGCKQVTPTIRRKAMACLQSEVEEYDQYLTGQVYGFEVKETGDSCWGFYGDMKYVIEEAKSSVDGHIKHERAEHIKKLKAWVKGRVGLLYREPFEMGGGAYA